MRSKGDRLYLPSSLKKLRVGLFMLKSKNCEYLCMVILIISGILWGLIGLFDFNPVLYFVFPCWAIRVIYVIFGLAALGVLCNWRRLIGKRS